MDDSLLLGVYSKQIEELIKRIESAIGIRLPREQDSQLTVALVGQYSAGKSSIVKMLSGKDDILIDEKIATQKVESVDWNGIRIIDTPGISTEIRPDHDEITMHAVASSDLIIFVVSSQGFSSAIGHYFRKLAIDEARIHEMLLCVNKMDSTAEGNTKEQQEIISEDLLKITSPLRPTDMYVTFISAEEYFEGLEATDQLERDYYFESSGYSDFVKNINALVEDKNVVSKLTTRISQGIDAIETASGDIKVQFDDSDFDRYLSKQKQVLKSLKQSRSAILDESRRTIDESIYKLRRLVSELSSDLTQELNTEEDAERLNTKFEIEWKKIEDELYRSLNSIREREAEESEKEVGRIQGKEVFQGIDLRVQRKLNLNGLKQPLEGAFQFLGKYADKTDEIKDIAKVVYRKLGKKAKPWEFVKISNKLAKAAKFAPILGVGVDAAFQWKEDADENSKERELRNQRNEIRAGMNEQILAIENYCINAMEEFSQEFYNKPIDEVAQSIKDVLTKSKSSKEKIEEYNLLREEGKKLLKEIYSL
jgi:GTPase SAR1 family protein